MNATMIVRDLAAGHGDRALFSSLDLVVAPGDAIGLVGVNGAGKTTLLRTLAGLLPVEAGTVTLSPPTANVGYLPQERERRVGETVRDFLARRTGVGPALVAMDAAAEALSGGAPGADETYAAALERWLDLGGADLDERAEAYVSSAPGAPAASASAAASIAASAGPTPVRRARKSRTVSPARRSRSCGR